MHLIQFHSENCTEKQLVKDVALDKLMQYVCVYAGMCVPACGVSKSSNTDFL